VADHDRLGVAENEGAREPLLGLRIPLHLFETAAEEPLLGRVGPAFRDRCFEQGGRLVAAARKGGLHEGRRHRDELESPGGDGWNIHGRRQS
jgi:hypothetical protein